MCRYLFFYVLSVLLTSNSIAVETAPREREFQLDYRASISDQPSGTRLRVWMPVPQSSDAQRVKTLAQNVPGDLRTHIEPVHGNKIAYFETTVPASGKISFGASYLVSRKEVRGLNAAADQENRKELANDKRELYLSASSRIPISGRPVTLLDQLQFGTDPVDVARMLYERVDEHVRYDKSEAGYGNGDVLWVCDSRFGNCTDFHSLFISFARSRGIPAKFEIGFPLPPDRGQGKLGGYHCWGQFYVDEYGWIPVDISEADKHPEMKEYFFGNITENRVTFSTGRDIDLVPKQTGPALNYFVYPYAEANGKQIPKKHFDLSFRYADQYLDRSSK